MEFQPLPKWAWVKTGWRRIKFSGMKRFILPISLLCLNNFLSYSQGVDIRIEEALNYQQKLNEEYASPKTSPLEKHDLDSFASLIFFPATIEYVVLANFKKRKGPLFKMKTSTDRLPLYKKYGEVYFEIKGEKFKLNVYQNVEFSKKKEYKNYLFLPFTDLTNGETTYGGGRYIDLEIPPGKSIVIDFNKAYNPYCAYSHSYSCPIVPEENFLNIKIEAGVKEGLIYK